MARVNYNALSAMILESKSLNAIRTALENLEDQLEFFHTILRRGSRATTLAVQCNYSSFTVSSKSVREIVLNFQTGSLISMQRRPFSSDSGDLIDAVVPFMGESITDGTLAKFLKQPGDRVEADEPIAQIETDKVTIDVSSPAAGVIQEFIAKEGDTVEPGIKIAIISKSGEAATHVAPSDKIPSKPTSEPSPVNETCSS